MPGIRGQIVVFPDDSPIEHAADVISNFFRMEREYVLLYRRSVSTLSRRVSMTTIQESIVDGPLNKLNKLARSAWQSILVTGVLSVLLGVVVLAWPGPTLVVAGVAFGIYLVASGLLQLISAFGLHADAGLRILAFISGILSLVLGYFCFNSTLESILLLAIWIGISWLFR
ncbi:DUF308 domain-containing protein [Nocardia seriolae]|uniref:DUF308 domain-containing protein n=1 Tax=Nocardia seriolae TaxID=37332 RepID=UPI0020137EC3|nr:DUF308 domain-containing protein [Nocardia seriolae]WNJ56209.1 DUF308 domain-containing protein [Nocardia seriolae]